MRPLLTVVGFVLANHIGGLRKQTFLKEGKHETYFRAAQRHELKRKGSYLTVEFGDWGRGPCPRNNRSTLALQGGTRSLKRAKGTRAGDRIAESPKGIDFEVHQNGTL